MTKVGGVAGADGSAAGAYGEVALSHSGSRPAATPRRLRGILSLDDFEARARRHLPKPLFGYIAGASETNASLMDNSRAFQAYGFKPRVLTDVSERSTQTVL